MQVKGRGARSDLQPRRDVRVIGAGAGGHARVMVDILLTNGPWKPLALTDPRPELHGKTVLGVPVEGDDSLLPGYFTDGILHAFVGLGGHGDNKPRQRLCEFVLGLGFELVPVVHSSATVSDYAVVGRAPTIFAAAVVNAGARLGNNVIVNTGAIVEHDCVVDDFAHIATGAALAGGVSVGQGAHVGAHATVRQGLRIGAGAIVGIGAAVVDDVPDDVIVAGVPARVLSPDTRARGPELRAQ